VVASSTAAAPTIAAVKRARYNGVGDQVLFEVTVAGFPAPTLQWQRSIDAGVTWQNVVNDPAYQGATSVRLTLASATAAMSGYQFRCVATNASGAAVQRRRCCSFIRSRRSRPGGRGGHGGRRRQRGTLPRSARPRAGCGGQSLRG